MNVALDGYFAAPGDDIGWSGPPPARKEFARNWRDTPKVVFSSTIDKVDRNTSLVTGDAGR